MKFLYIALVYCVKKFLPRYKYKLYTLIKNKDINLLTVIKYSQLKILLNLGDYIQYFIYMDGIYEDETVEFAYKNVDKKVFLDIGANIGNYTLSLCNTASYIYSFEASSENIKYLKQNIKRNNISNVNIIYGAISDSNDKTVKLILSNDALGNNSIFSNDANCNYELVKTITIDSFCEKNNVSDIGVIKLDIEGSEYNAILGAMNIIKRDKPIIICEFNSTAALSAGWKLEDLYNCIINLGYECFLYHNVLKKFDELNLKADGFSENLIFIMRP